MDNHTDVPCGSAGKESTCSAGDLGLISGLGRSPRKGKAYSLQYFSLENSMNCIPWGRKELDKTATFTHMDAEYTLVT